MARWKVAASAVLVLAVTLVWLFFARGAPLHIVIEADGDRATISVDGQRHEVDWLAMPTHVRFLRQAPFLREYQIDGSDSTGQGTLNLSYFERLATTPYYRFQSWLRDEASYNRWAGIGLSDAAGRSLMRTDSIAIAEQVRLPASYTLSAGLYRPEKWAALLLTDDGDSGYIMSIERDVRAIALSRWENGKQTATLQSWYFPENPRPFIAMLWDTLAHILLWAVALVAAAALVTMLLSLIPWHALPPLVARMAWTRRGVSSRSTGLVACLILLASFGMVTYITLAKYNGLPHIFDSLSMFMQAKIMASGRMFVPYPPDGWLFDYPFMVNSAGRYFSQYPPGVPATIALFMLISPSLGWLSGPFVSVATLAGIYGLGRMMYGTRVALLSLLLVALSPFYNYMAGSLMSHPYSLFYLTFFLLFLVRYDQTRGIGDLVLSGMLLGMAAISREPAALFFAVPWLAIIFGRAIWRRRWAAVPDIIILTAMAALVGSLYLRYNALLTGDPLRSPRALFDAYDHYGFGDVGFYGRHTLAAGLVVTDEQVTMLLIHLFGWPFYLTLAPALIPFISGRFRGWDAANALAILAFLAGFVGYYYHGIVYGPRYYYEALPFFVLLTARGFQVASNIAGQALARVWTRRGQTWQGPAAPAGACAVLAALVACNLLYYMPRQMQLYDGFAGESKKPDLKTIYGTHPPNAVIMTDDMFVYRDVLAPLNCVDFTLCDPAYVLVHGDADVAAVKRVFPGRSLYWLSEKDGHALFVPEGGG